MTNDKRTAAAFAESWNRIGTVYTRAQFDGWMAPLHAADFANRDVLELGYGNGSLLAHVGTLGPRRLVGLELGDTAEQTRRNLGHLPPALVDLQRGDMIDANLGEFDVVYCIGVLHHLAEPWQGFEAVLRHTRRGGRFHCWVYGYEGNGVVRRIVDPLRRISSRMPWWLTKYGIALPLVIPYYCYAKLARLAPSITRHLPLGDYTLWIAREDLRFFHHVAFDQLVTPRTVYLRRAEIEAWLKHPEVEPSSVYIVSRNGNSWTFGGRRRLR